MSAVRAGVTKSSNTEQTNQLIFDRVVTGSATGQLFMWKGRRCRRVVKAHEVVFRHNFVVYPL